MTLFFVSRFPPNSIDRVARDALSVILVVFRSRFSGTLLMTLDCEAA